MVFLLLDWAIGSSHLIAGQLRDVVGADGSAPLEGDGGQRPDLAQTGPGSAPGKQEAACQGQAICTSSSVTRLNQT